MQEMGIIKQIEKYCILNLVIQLILNSYIKFKLI